MKSTKCKVVIVTPEDLVITSQGKEHPTVNDLSGMAKKEIKLADLVIFIDESNVKTIMVFNNDLIEEPLSLEGRYTN